MIQVSNLTRNHCPISSPPIHIHPHFIYLTKQALKVHHTKNSFSARCLIIMNKLLSCSFLKSLTPRSNLMNFRFTDSEIEKEKNTANLFSHARRFLKRGMEFVIAMLLYTNAATFGFISSHPFPLKRYRYIQQESAMLTLTCPNVSNSILSGPIITIMVRDPQTTWREKFPPQSLHLAQSPAPAQLVSVDFVV